MNKKLHKIAIYKIESCYGEPDEIMPSSWDEVTTEELDKLSKYCQMTQARYSGIAYYLIEQVTVDDFKLEIADIIKQAEEFAAKEKKRLAAIELKNKKSAATRAKKQEEKERKKLAELQKKYG